MRVLNDRDRDVILAAARQKEEIIYGNAKLSFYPDFTAEVQKKRRQFSHIRSRLRDLGFKYAMLYKTHFFNTPEEAADWLDRRPQVT